VSNNNFKNDNVPSILKPYLVSRKFIVDINNDKTALQFGSGDANVSNVVADPQNVALDIFGKDYVTDTTFDPTRLSKDTSYGIVPSNTSLTVVYTFPSQNRAVTQSDYENLSYRMPAKFGSLKRCSVQRDPDSMKRNLNMYVMSEDKFGKLIASNTTIKNNLKTWLNHYRMINDTVDILDAHIINFGIDFIIAPNVGVDKYDLLAASIAHLRDKFGGTKYYIGEHLMITEIYKELNKVKGIMDVIKVTLVNKTGGVYSATEFDISANLSPEGTYLIAPKNCIFELKYPETDVKGKIR
jgi:hypothetical protein